MDAKSKFLGTGKGTITFGSVVDGKFQAFADPTPVDQLRAEPLSQSLSWLPDESWDEDEQPVSLATTRECHLTLELAPGARSEFLDYMLRDIQAAWHEYLMSVHRANMAILRVGNSVFVPDRLILRRPSAASKSEGLGERYSLAMQQIGDAARKAGTELHHAMAMISRSFDNRLTKKHFDLLIDSGDMQADLTVTAKKPSQPFWMRDWRKGRR